jgi:hypothetical protein
LPGNEYHSLPTYNHYAGSVDYAYNRFHTLSMVMEVGPIRSGFLRARELLRVGNGRWEYECFDGYPNRIIAAPCVSSFVLKSGGVTAAARRVNRVRLWRQSRNLIIGVGNRHATHIAGFVSRRVEDFERLPDIFNLSGVLKEFEAGGEKYDNTRAWLRQAGLEELGCFSWHDGYAVSRFRERPEGRDFPLYGYDESLHSVDTPAAVSLRFRIDAEVQARRVFVNDVELRLCDVRQWRDSRFGYIEVDIDEKWQRAFVGVETTPRSSCRLFDTNGDR